MIIRKILKTRKQLKDLGVIETIHWALIGTFYKPLKQWDDNSFDRRYGTDTTRSIYSSEFLLDKKMKEHANHYQATPVRVFHRCFSKDKVDYTDYTFIDLGCGKGRALLLASRLPFKKIIGVEIDPALHAICERNIEIYTSKNNNQRSSIDAMCMSAGEFDIPSGNILIYLFNPFDTYIMQQVIDKIRIALKEESRIIKIKYFHPLNIDPIKSLPGIKIIKDETFRSRAIDDSIGRVVTFEIRS